MTVLRERGETPGNSPLRRERRAGISEDNSEITVRTGRIVDI